MRVSHFVAALATVASLSYVSPATADCVDDIVCIIEDLVCGADGVT